MKVFMMRHGATEGNLAKRYIGGKTDEPLCAQGVLQLAEKPIYTRVEHVFTSGMKRTVQTAQIVYPNAAQTAIPALREMEFGRFEGCTAGELEKDVTYTAWVAGGCNKTCPNGESRSVFVKRCRTAFCAVLANMQEQEAEEVHFVVHGGTIMAVASELALPQLEYFAAATPYGGQWVFQWEKGVLHTLQRPGGTCI